MTLKQLMKIEWLKFSHRNNYIFLISIIFIILLLIQVTSSILGDVNLEPSMRMISTFSYLHSFVIIPLYSCFLIFNITKEFETGVVKKNISDGLSKHQYFIAKLLFTLSIVIFFYFIIIFSLSILLLLNNLSITRNVLCTFNIYFLDAIFLSALPLFLSFTIRKSNIAILGLIGIFLLENALAVQDMLIWKNGISSFFITKSLAFFSLNNPIEWMDYVKTPTYFVLLLIISEFSFYKKQW